jgi:hypothetical protein
VRSALQQEPALTGNLGFPLKSLARAGIVLQIVRKEFERDVALEERILGEEKLPPCLPYRGS